MPTTTLKLDDRSRVRTIALLAVPCTIGNTPGFVTLILDQGRGDGAVRDLDYKDFTVETTTDWQTGEHTTVIRLSRAWTRAVVEGDYVAFWLFGNLLEIK